MILLYLNLSPIPHGNPALYLILMLLVLYIMFKFIPAPVATQITKPIRFKKEPSISIDDLPSLILIKNKNSK